MSFTGHLFLGLLEGVVSGLVIALTAMGLSLVFGVMRIVNVAHGEFFMLGAVLAWYFSSLTGSFYPALVAAPIIVALVALLADRFIMRLIRYAPEATIVATIGLLYILQQLVLTFYGPYARPVAAPIYFRVDFPWFGYSGYKLVVAALAALVLAALWLVVTRTRLGLYMRATQQDREIAQAFGVPTERVYAAAFALGAVLAPIAGVLIVPVQPAHYLMGLHGMLARIMVFASYATGYNLLLGYTGLMSLGHAMFFAAGMYGTGLTVYYLGFGALPAILIGLLASIAVALVIGWITLRTTGVSFLIVTMMFAQAFFLATLYFNRITGGDQGLVLTGRLPPLYLGPLTLSLAQPGVKYNVALVVFTACVLLGLWLVRSPAGRVLIAIRENEERARMIGYNTFHYKWLALTISGAVSGLAGSTYTLLFSYLGSSFASILYSIFPLLWTLVGGVGTIIGPLLGTTFMTYVVDITSGYTTAYLIVVGAALVILIMRFPQGIMGAVRARWPQWLP